MDYLLVMRSLLLLVSSLLITSALADDPSLPNQPGGPSWLSGAGQINTPDGYNTRMNWLGYQTDILVAWSNLSGESWADWRDGGNAYFRNALDHSPPNTIIVHAMPMIAPGAPESNRRCANPSMWTDFNNGDFDADYTTMANNMKALIDAAGRSYTSIVIRLGWEMNGDWYAWSVCNEVAAFKNAWARAHGLMTAVMPGLRFDFSPARPYVGYNASGGRFNYLTSAGVDMAGFYPGDDYVDYISVSHHDAHPFVTNESTWQEHVQGRNQRKIGLQEAYDLAVARGKFFVLSEWGTQFSQCSSASFTASPNPALFIRKTYEFLVARAANVAWDAYFSQSCTNLYNRQNTAAAQTYKQLWAQQNDPGSPPDPEPNPDPEDCPP